MVGIFFLHGQHASPREENDAKINPMMWQNHDSNHWNQLHALPEDGETADTCKVHINNFLFIYLYKKQKCP
jgi:hypothetical protein